MPPKRFSLELSLDAKVRWWVRPMIWMLERGANLVAEHGVKVSIMG